MQSLARTCGRAGARACLRQRNVALRHGNPVMVAAAVSVAARAETRLLSRGGFGSLLVYYFELL